MFDLNKKEEKKEGREEGEAECSVTEPRETRKEHIGREVVMCKVVLSLV